MAEEKKKAMIKNLLNADEEPPEGTKVIIEETVVDTPPAAPVDAPAFGAENPPQAVQAAEKKEIRGESESFAADPSAGREPAPLDESAESYEALMTEIENLSPEEFDRLEREIYLVPETAPGAEKIEAPPVGAEKIPVAETPAKMPFESYDSPKADISGPSIFQSDYTPPSTAETIRNSGLAWSAGVVLFGSVIFMMIFGWFADLLLGSSPWGIIGGILLGGFIGIFQLFRITSQIYKK